MAGAYPTAEEVMRQQAAARPAGGTLVRRDIGARAPGSSGVSRTVYPGIPQPPAGAALSMPRPQGLAPAGMSPMQAAPPPLQAQQPDFARAQIAGQQARQGQFAQADMARQAASMPQPSAQQRQQMATQFFAAQRQRPAGGTLVRRDIGARNPATQGQSVTQYPGQQQRLTPPGAPNYAGLQQQLSAQQRQAAYQRAADAQLQRLG